MLKSEKTSLFGKMMILEGSILIVPIILLPCFLDEVKYTWLFLIPGLLSVAAGVLVCLFIPQKKVNSNRLVVASWMYGFVLAAIPFYLYGGINPMQALFESVSGFTTTGLSVLDVSVLPKLFLFYRSFLQFIGGLGFVMMILFFVQGKHSVKLYQAEGHPDRLEANIGKTVKVIVKMYSFFLVAGTGLYIVAGMPVFDSLLHTMCALSTGGFSNRLDSIGYYHSIPIEIITVFLMLIGTTNFSLLLLIFKGKIKEFFKSSEMRFLAGLVVIIVPIMAFFLAKGGMDGSTSMRQSFFNAFSAISTTGYATSSYTSWPDNAIVLMIILMVIGGGIGSTAGGMKLGRVCIATKVLWKNVKRKMRPERQVILCSYSRGSEKEVLDKEKVEEAETYIHVYFILFLLGSILLSYFAGTPFLHGAFEFASSLGTVGLSIGLTSMKTSNICLFIEIVGMILGRLEIFVLFKIFTKRQC